MLMNRSQQRTSFLVWLPDKTNLYDWSCLSSIKNKKAKIKPGFEPAPFGITTRLTWNKKSTDYPYSTKASKPPRKFIIKNLI